MLRFKSYSLERAFAGPGSLAWQVVGAPQVRLRRLRHRLTVQRGQTAAVATHEARLRPGLPVEPGMRLSRDGRHFFIHSVELFGRRENWLRCLCEEQQPLGRNLQSVTI